MKSLKLLYILMCFILAFFIGCQKKGKLDTEKNFERMPPGGYATFNINGQINKFEFTDGFYCFSENDNSLDVIELKGNSLSLTAEVPLSSQPRDVNSLDFSALKGANLKLSDYSASFEDPYILLNNKDKCKVIGGVIIPEEVITFKQFETGKADSWFTGSIKLIIQVGSNNETLNGQINAGFIGVR